MCNAVSTLHVVQHVTLTACNRRDVAQRRNRDVADGELLLGDPRASNGPVFGREFEVATARPVRKDVDDVEQVGFGVQPVQLARGDEREDVCGWRRSSARRRGVRQA
jgi:hypothetical protein